LESALIPNSSPLHEWSGDIIDAEWINGSMVVVAANETAAGSANMVRMFVYDISGDEKQQIYSWPLDYRTSYLRASSLPRDYILAASEWITLPLYDYISSLDIILIVLTYFFGATVYP
jgi:hypothetical protein